MDLARVLNAAPALFTQRFSLSHAPPRHPRKTTTQAHRTSLGRPSCAFDGRRSQTARVRPALMALALD
ncbi:hypothetical protein CCO03_03455 [Comamonas serinivorans]|uniref:Uncharacterized protein n=1 Tax=Comamonas serinivorans TaxID=1082851 RepID=A0A1Y0EKP3_9BURK|nr:hypothetical protein [Comamonas serinivorans]ARU03862.1 hypothetical protein CCO03_03455 [Comamonas serinivorans]